MNSDDQRELLGRLLAVQQQNIDLRARLDLEHQAGEGFLRFGERALNLDGLLAFWELAAEETVSTFGTESALVLRLEDDGGTTLCATSCLDRVEPAELVALGACVRRGLRERRGYGESPTLPTLDGRPTAFALTAGFRDRSPDGGQYAIVGVVSVEKRPFYPPMDEKLGPLFAAFANHAAALQQHIRVTSAARTVAAQMQRLAEVANRTSNAVVVADAAGRIEWVNESFERLTGWPLAEVRGRRPGDFLQGPATSLACRQTMSAGIRAWAPFDLEVVNSARDERQYWVYIETRVIHDERGAPTGFVAVETDITERRLNALQDALAQAVAAELLAGSSFDATVAQRLAETLVGTLASVGAQAAHIWVVEPQRDALHPLAGATAPGLGEAGAAFLRTTRALAFVRGATPTPGVGVPGAVWGSGAGIF